MSDERGDYMRQVTEGTSPSAIQNDPQLVLIPVELRDWFAGQALPACISGKVFGTLDATALAAYDYADAMLKARTR
jgi:hypothetical protein